jgi:hypothetical protein
MVSGLEAGLQSNVSHAEKGMEISSDHHHVPKKKNPFRSTGITMRMEVDVSRPRIDVWLSLVFLLDIKSIFYRCTIWATYESFGIIPSLESQKITNKQNTGGNPAKLDVQHLHPNAISGNALPFVHCSEFQIKPIRASSQSIKQIKKTPMRRRWCAQNIHGWIENRWGNRRSALCC